MAKTKIIKDSRYLFCTEGHDRTLDRSFWNCSLEHWEQGLFAKIKNAFNFNVFRMSMSDVVKDQTLDVNGTISITFKHIEKANTVMKTECELFNFQPAKKEGDRNKGTSLECIRHTSLKLK